MVENISLKDHYMWVWRKNAFKPCKGNYAGIEYNFRNIWFTLYGGNSNSTLLISANTQKILRKKDIQLSDYTRFRNNVVGNARLVVKGRKLSPEEVAKYKEESPYNNLNIYNTKRCMWDLLLHKIEYYADIPFNTQKELNEVCKLLGKYQTQTKGMKSIPKYKDGICLYNKKGMTNIEIYNKYTQSNNDTKYKNTLRLKVVCKNSLIKKLFEKEGIKRNLRNYWTKDMYQRLFIDFLKSFLYEGNYYKLHTAIEKVENSSYSKVIKRNLCNFLKEINENNMDYSKKLHTLETINNWTRLLEDIGVNPITLPENSTFNELPNLIKLIQEQAEEKYFK